MATARFLFVVGTRPEAIKLAPIVLRLRHFGPRAEALVCLSGQHPTLAEEALRVFDITPDYRLPALASGSSTLAVAAQTGTALETLFARQRPDTVLVLGDTATAFAGAVAAAHCQIPVAHVEAGLRTGDNGAPFPEEIYRRVIAVVATHHFAPTVGAAGNLRREGIDSAAIHITGNPGIDALHLQGLLGAKGGSPRSHCVLVTMHRREALGPVLVDLFAALRRLALRFPKASFLCPLHPNPRLVTLCHEGLGTVFPSNIIIAPPLNYREFIGALTHCDFVISDSGGLQEEAPVFGKPVIVVRDRTDRPEGIEAGNAILVGLDGGTMEAAAARLLEDDVEYCRLARPVSPFGDGKAAERIVDILRADFGGAAG